MRIAACTLYRPNGRDCPGRLTGHPNRCHSGMSKLSSTHALTFPQAPTAPRDLQNVVLCNQEGAGNAGRSATPAASCAKIESTRVRHHRFAETIRHSLRDGLNGFLRALPGDRASLSPSLARSSPRKLDISVGISEPHDFAVRKPHRSSGDTICGHRIPRSTFVTTRPPLLMSARRAGF